MRTRQSIKLRLLMCLAAISFCEVSTADTAQKITVDVEETYDFKSLSKELTDDYTKPTFGDNVTNDMQMISLSNNNFNNRFSTGSRSQNGSDNCFRFRKTSNWEGLHSAYSGRYFSIRALKAGDKVQITMNSSNSALKFREGSNSISVSEASAGNNVTNDGTYTVVSDGILDFETTGACIIEKVVISTQKELTLGGYATYDFTGKGESGGTAYTSSGKIISGDQTLDVISFDGESFGNRFAVSSGFKFRSNGDWKGLWNQSGTNYLSILGLSAGDRITFNIPKDNGIEFKSTSDVKLPDGTTPSNATIVNNQEYEVTSAGDLNLITPSSGSVHIYSIKIAKKETLTDPTITLKDGVKNTVTITVGTTDDGSASVTTYYTTDGTAPSATNGTAITATTDVPLYASCTVKAITISSTGRTISATDYTFTYEDITATYDKESYNFKDLKNNYDSDGGSISGINATKYVAAGSITYSNKFAVSGTATFKRDGDWNGLKLASTGQYFTILGLNTGDKVTIAMKDDRKALSFSSINAQAANGDAVTAEASVENGATYTITSSGNLELKTTGETYIQAITIENKKTDGSENTDVETVSAPTVAKTSGRNNSVTITTSETSKGNSTIAYYNLDGVPSAYTNDLVPDGGIIDFPVNCTVVRAIAVSTGTGKISEVGYINGLKYVVSVPTIGLDTENSNKIVVTQTEPAGDNVKTYYHVGEYTKAGDVLAANEVTTENGWVQVPEDAEDGKISLSIEDNGKNIYAVTINSGVVSAVSDAYAFTYSETANAAAPTITASDNKVTITTKEEGATTKYYIGNEAEGTTITGTSATIEDLNANTTITAVSTKDGKQDATTNFTFTYISTLPTITQGASSNEVAITIGNATLGEGETITTTYQIGESSAETITANTTLQNLTSDDDGKTITVTTSTSTGNTVTASLVFSYYTAPVVSDGKIDVTYDFTGFTDKTDFTQASPLATTDNDFDNRFAVSRITGDAGFWLRSYSDKTKGLYSRYADRTLTVKNLTAGDKVTINWHCDDSQNTDNDGKFVLTDGTDVVSGSPIVIAEDGDLTIKSAKGGTNDPYVTITSIIIHEAETLSAPTIAVNPENSNEVIITAGKTNNADATVTTYYAITTDGTDPVPTKESTTKFTGSGAKETITLTQSIKIKAISVSSTEDMAEQPSEVKEFTYVAETLTAPTIKLALADNSVVITAGKSNNEEAIVTTYYSLNGEAPTISETNEQKFTGESKELTLEADATIIAVSVSSTGKVDNATSEAFAFTYDAPDGKTRFNTTYDFTEKDGNPINQDAEHKVTSNGTSLYLLAYDDNTNFDNRFAIGPDSRTGNGGFYFRNNNATYKGLFTGYDSRNFSVLNLKKGDKVTLTLSNNAETLQFVEGDVVLSGKAYTAKADGNMDFVTLTGGVYIEKVVIAEAEAVQAPTLTLSEDGTKVTIAAGASNNPEATVSTYYTTTGSISFNDGKAVTEGLTRLTADNSVVTVAGTTNIEAITISNGGAESIVTKGSYVEPVVESDSKTYSFIGYGDKTGVIPAYATETTSGGQTLYLLATGEQTFDNRFAVGPKREDANVFKFREDGNYKGLYSQYDKRYFSILNLKKGEKVTLTINGNAETLQFADAAKVLEMTGGTNAAKVAEGAKVKSGTTYYINEDGNLDFVTTGSIYIESAKISAAVEDEELTIAETVSKPTITDNGDNTVSITAGVSDADKKVTTYYTTDGSVPTAESAEYKEALALTADCTVKAITISEQGTKSEVEELAFTYVAPVEGLESYDFVVAEAGQTAAPTFGDTVEGTDLQMLAYGTKTFGNRFAVGPTSRNDGTSSGFTFRTSGDYKGLWSQYADRNFSILSLKQGDKVTITISKEAATLKFSDASKALEITSATDNTAAKLAKDATAKSGTAYYITADCNLDFVTTGGVYIESVKIEEAAEGDTAPTIAETVSKPTITDNGDNTVSITAGVSDADKKVTTYYTTDGSVPTAESTKYEEALALTADCTVKAITISEQGTKSEVAELAFTIKVPTHQDGYGLFDFTLYGKDDKGADAIVKPDYGTDGELAIGKEDFDNRFISGPSNRIEDNTCFRFRNSGNYKGLWSQYSDRTLALKDLAISDTIIITMNASAAALKFTGTPIVANVESGDNVESGKVYIVTTAGQLDLITSGEAYIEDIVINKGNGTLPELVSTPKMQPRQGKYNTVIIVPGKSSDSKAQVTTYYTTDGSEPTAANGTAINRETDVTFAATTTAVKAVSISSTGAVGDVATYAVSYVEPIANGEPYSFVGYGSTGGVVPEWGRTVTASGETQQLIAIGIEDFGERFAAGPTSQNTGANCFKFREAGGYQGLFSQYADRYFSVLNLRVGDQVIVNISKKDDEEVNLYSTVTGRAVESGEPITVTSPGSLLFRSTGSVYIESVLILNTGSGTYLEPYDEEEDEDNTGDDNTGDNTGGDTPQEPEQPNTPVENEDGSVTTAYSFTSFGDASGVVPEWGEDVQVGDVTLQMLSIGDEDFGNRIACGPKRGDDKVFKFRNSGGYQGLYSQYADRYLSILDLKNGDQVTIVMNANANNLAFNGDPQVEVEQPSRARAKAIAATTEPSNGDKVGSGVTYTVKTSQASTSLDFVTTGSVYITQIIIREAAGTTRILDIEKLRDSGIERIYDMSGRRVQQMVKGRLYIVNGKKVLYK